MGAVTVKDLGITRIRKQLAQLARARILVGVQGSAAAQPHPDSNESVGTIAKWLHFGTANMPARPYVDVAIAAMRGEVGTAARASVKKLVGSKYVDVGQAMAPLGEVMLEQVRDAIDNASSWAAPLAASTVKAKGHSRPLVDTGTVRDAVSWVVVDGSTVLAEGGAR